MPPPLQDKDTRDLSTDVKYLYQMANAISTGVCSIQLANIKPGPISHSRWIKKASRLLRLYVATNTPSANLKILVIYIIRVYVPMYFNVKFYSSVVYGSVLFSKFIRFTQYLNKNLRDVINTVIKNNAYYAHTENILLAMLFDDRKTIRNMAI